VHAQISCFTSRQVQITDAFGGARFGRLEMTCGPLYIDWSRSPPLLLCYYKITCFISTKVRLLTPEELRSVWTLGYIARGAPHFYICVLILLHMCPYTAVCVSSYHYVCPHTTISVSSYYYICVLILLTISVSSYLLHMCPRTTVHVSSYYICPIGVYTPSLIGTEAGTSSMRDSAAACRSYRP
jgi:hypothetical protein